MVPHGPIVNTPWRSAQELLQLRRELYWHAEIGDEDRRQEAVNQMQAWRAKFGELPLLLDNTIDLVCAVVHNEKGGPVSSLKMVYGGAITRTITGISDTMADLQRNRPEWMDSPAFSDNTIYKLKEVRHCFVHRQMPTLSELRLVAQQLLELLWTNYWSQLDAAFCPVTFSSSNLKPDLQLAIQSYKQSRKTEIKTPKHRLSNTLSSAALKSARAIKRTLPAKSPSKDIDTLADLLITKMIPADRELGQSMQGAFLLWHPLLANLFQRMPMFHSALQDRLLSAMNNSVPTGAAVRATRLSPQKEALCEWLVHVSLKPESRFEGLLEECFSAPTYWNLRVAEGVLRGYEGEDGGVWKGVLWAAGEEEEAEVQQQQEQEHGEDAMQGVVGAVTAVEAVIARPMKHLGMYKLKPLGYMNEGEEDDE
ncbi:Las1-domain-containing protein [Polyplosphaeria fusca]|uniref:Las1-domain-containing protein n=1 Tax=Polyplosphaeria fusca TaxID=682080 RepID=A0A9P4QZL6_9PLEO|nr:Las1-domain-containing protein [Polyplosphaeria fusca]